MFRRKNEISFLFVICLPYYVRYHLVFSGQHIFHEFRQQTFSAHIFNKLFFLTVVATNFFFIFFLHPPPPPADIKWCIPNKDHFLGWLTSQ